MHRLPSAALALALLAVSGCGSSSETPHEASSSPARTRFVRVSEVSLRVAELGPRDAPVRLVIHDGPGLDHTVLRPWLDRLSNASTRVLYVDLRGHGRSDEPSEGAGYTLTAAAMDLAELLQREAPGGTADLVAHGFGAAVALTLAANRPERVHRMVLIAPLTAASQLRTLPARTRELLGPMRSRRLDALLSAQGTLRSAREVSAYLHALEPLWWSGPVPVGATNRFARELLYHPESDENFRALLGGWDARSLAAEVRAPTLVLAGENDRVFPAESARNLAAALPHGRYAEVAQSGHLPFAERPTGFWNAVEPFLSEH